FFTPGAGSGGQTPANVWTAGAFIAATGSINGVAATTDTFQITGVVILPGVEVPSAARSPLIMRPYDQELMTCRRYWQLRQLAFDMQATVVGQVLVHNIQFDPPMRATPALTVGTPYFTPSGVGAVNPIASGTSTPYGITLSAPSTAT